MKGHRVVGTRQRRLTVVELLSWAKPDEGIRDIAKAIGAPPACTSWWSQTGVVATKWEPAARAWIAERQSK